MGRLFASESFAFESSLLQTRVRNLLPINDHFLGQTNQLDCNAIGVSHYAKNPANRSGSIRIVRYEYNANCYLFWAPSAARLLETLTTSCVRDTVISFFWISRYNNIWPLSFTPFKQKSNQQEQYNLIHLHSTSENILPELRVQCMLGIWKGSKRLTRICHIPKFWIFVISGGTMSCTSTREIFSSYQHLCIDISQIFKMEKNHQMETIINEFKCSFVGSNLGPSSSSASRWRNGRH